MMQGIILDWGGVLCVDPSPGFISYSSRKLQIAPERLGPAVRAHLHAFMLGLPESEFWSRVGAEIGEPLAPGPLWGEALAAVYVEIPETFSIARTLRRGGFKVGLLTNTEGPSREFHLARGYDFFDARVFSCEEGIAKPDVAIYELMAKRLKLAPADCLMVDDRPENIAGARAAGMQVHQFNTTDNLFRAVAKHLRF